MPGWFGGETAAPGQAQQAFQAPTPGAFPAGSASQGVPGGGGGEYIPTPAYLQQNATGGGLPGGLGNSGLGGDGGGWGDTFNQYYNQAKQMAQDKLNQFGNWATGDSGNYGSSDTYAGTTEGPDQFGNVNATMQDIQSQGGQ